MFAKNKKINNYNIIKIINAGIVLKGWEVKTIKLKKYINIENSYIINVKNEIFLKESYIDNNNFSLEEKKRNRKILLKKNEIKFIIKKFKNYKIIPINLFLKKNIIKIKIAIVLKKWLKM